MSEVKYTISDLENFTNIKAHTIRIWEQRYNLLTPDRASRNIRYYSENDLKKILNINLLYKNGWKISRIASITESELIEEAKHLIEQYSEVYNYDIDNLISLLLDFDKDTLSENLDALIEKDGLVVVYTEVVIPLLVKIGQLWQVNSIEIVHEHFFSNIFKNAVISKIEALPAPSASNKKAILFLHEEEEHEMSLLVSYFILMSLNIQCFYFGPRTPREDVVLAIEKINPEYILTHFLATLEKDKLEAFLNYFDHISQERSFILSGNQSNKELNKKFKHFVFLRTPQSLIDEISK